MLFCDHSTTNSKWIETTLNKQDGARMAHCAGEAFFFSFSPKRLYMWENLVLENKENGMLLL